MTGIIMTIQINTRKPMGFIWWIADNVAEAEKWAKDIQAKGGVVVKSTQDKDGQVDFVFAVNKENVAEALGYIPEEEEWLTLSPYEVTLKYMLDDKVCDSVTYRLAATNEVAAIRLAMIDSATQGKYAESHSAYGVYPSVHTPNDEDLHESVCSIAA